MGRARTEPGAPSKLHPSRTLRAIDDKEGLLAELESGDHDERVSLTVVDLYRRGATLLGFSGKELVLFKNYPNADKASDALKGLGGGGRGKVKYEH
jgi:hypothetical protein